MLFLFLFLVFFEFQALLDVFLSLPFLLAALNPTPKLSPWEYSGFALWLVALLGEAIADAQLTAFKRDPASHGQVCQRGLWGYSRHPNYFFEWLIWVAWALFALGSPYGWVAILCPLLQAFSAQQAITLASTPGPELSPRTWCTTGPCLLGVAS